MRYGDTWAPVRGDTSPPNLFYDEVYLGPSEFIKHVWSQSGDIMDYVGFHNQSDVHIIPRFHHGSAINYANTALLYINGSYGDYGGEKLFCYLMLHHL